MTNFTEVNPLANVPKKNLGLTFNEGRSNLSSETNSEQSEIRIMDKLNTMSPLESDPFRSKNSNKQSERFAPVKTPKTPPSNKHNHQSFHKVESENKMLELNTEVLNEIFKDKDKSLMVKAMEIVRNRKEERENNLNEKREPVNVIVQKTKEIYLIELTTSMINQEIQKLKILEIEMASSIKKKEKELDLKNAEARKNFDDKKKEMEIEVERANMISNEKAQLLREIKSKTLILSSLINENKKLDDLVANYKELKIFLDTLSPDFFKDKVANLPTENSNPKDSFSQQNDQSASKLNRRSSGKKLTNRSAKTNTNEPHTEKQMPELTRSSSSEVNIYFESPEQLIERINSIEEKNLLMMQANQEEEQNLVDHQNRVKELKIEKSEKIESLKQLRDNLSQQIEANYEEITRLQAKKANNDKEFLQESLQKVESTLFTLYQTFRYDFDRSHQITSSGDFKDKKHIINCLSDIEKLLYKYSISIRRENPETLVKNVK